MDAIIITPHVGIGPFRLGMCREEVERTFQSLGHLRADNGIPGNPSYIEILFMREHFEYDANSRVKFIQLINPQYSGNICIPCLFQGVDVFTTKAEDLIHTFSKYYSMVGDVDPRTGFSFAIQELELCFWREGIMNDEIIKDPGFLEMSEENQELEKRYFYFTTVSIGALGYFDFMDDYPGS
ncbi:hypothetical protein MHI43_15680 [Paenibacillus sp. FSL H8-0457]|uniref:hypothetical protein n=1 Tax=unclassified Paenibacillus TaxID=185978 RepID=UPI0001789C5C|nr:MULTISPECIES: hypothetical protein [unclassified Paenibacillus]ACX65319.1 conserved hypothetical protein [Paenibacillus sp. Y412MC10]ETT62750.1 hypothetical protein C172_16286 [Paenibacillus sp. FSL H8-457]